MTCPSLGTLLEAGVSAGFNIRFGTSAVPVSGVKLWNSALRASSWFSEHRGETVGMLLLNSRATVSTLAGAVISGSDIASLPLPPRGAGARDYRDFVMGLAKGASVTQLVVDDPWASLLQDLPIPCTSTSEILSTAPSPISEAPSGSLIQFSSGSTAVPKGVVIPWGTVAKHTQLILEHLEVEPGDSSCSWLPLSHDMGLIGMLFASWVGAGPDYAPGGGLWLLEPEMFLTRPRSWLDACASVGATITAAPSFALRIAAQKVAPEGLNLRRVRSCVIGAELVESSTLAAFVERFSGAGLNPNCLCPAYGLAEATLAVTLSKPGTPWTVATIDRTAAGRGDLHTVGANHASARALVGCGPPLPNIRVDAPKDRIGPIKLHSPTLLRRYSTDFYDRTPDDWLDTGDVGFMLNGELFPVGRSDDVYLSGGRKVFAQDLELAAIATGFVQPGKVATITDGDDLGLIVESTDSDLQSVALALRVAATRRTGVAVAFVAFVEPRLIPRTSSGKVQRNEARRRLESGALHATIVRWQRRS